MINHEVILTEVLKKTFDWSDDDVQANLFEDKDGKKEFKSDAVDVILNKQIDKLNSIKNSHKEELTKIHDIGYTKALSESKKKVLSEIETEFEKKYNHKIDGNFMDSIDSFIASISKDKGGKVTDEDIKKHPAFNKLEQEYLKTKEIADKLAGVENDFNSFKSNVEKNNKLSKVKKQAILNLNNLNPVLPEDNVKKEKWINTYLSEFNNFEDFLIDENDNIIGVVKDGKRVEDALGNPLSFNKLSKSIADNYFDYKVQDPKGSTGNKNDGDTTPLYIPKTIEEYKAFLHDDKIDATTKAKVIQKYKESN